MNYTQINRNAVDKFNRYTLAQCETAIADIHATLALHEADDMHNAYVVKLWAELDAARDRIHALKGKTLHQRRVLASAHALINSL
jgi:hypothetical protein